MKKLSKTTSRLFIILIAAAITGCGEESPRTDYAARVNDSYLTQKELDRIIDSTPGNNFYRNEIIRNWINREILFLRAVDKGIIKKEDYKRVVEDSKKQLAAAMLLEQIYNDEEITYDDAELLEFYNQQKEDFRLTEEHYLLNTARFKTEEEAILFRNRVVESKWDEAVTEFTEKNSAMSTRESVFLSGQEIHPVTVLRVVRELYPGEISIVINESPDQYTVMQMLQKYEPGTIPPEGVIKEKLSRRFMNNKKQEMLKNYLQELYSEFEIEIKQD